MGVGGKWLGLLLVAATWVALPSYGALDWCRLYLERLSQAITREPTVQWMTDHLHRGPLSRLGPEESRKRVREIIDQIYDPKSALGEEIDRVSTKMMSDPNWLKDYFRSYEVFYWSPMYHDIVERMHAALPPSGSILDTGSGTGGMGGLMAEAGPRRDLTFQDGQLAMDLARTRISRLFPEQDARFSYLPIYMSPRTKLPEKGNFQGAMINHVLYTMPPSSKEGALKAIAERMPSGGTIAINEPVKEVAAQGDKHREWLTQVIETAVANGAPQSEFDIATIIAFSSGRATKSLRMGSPLTLPFQTREEHEAMFLRQGFRVESSSPTYNGFSRFWVLKKI